MIEILPGMPEIQIIKEIPEIVTTIGNPVTIALNLKNQGKGECINLIMQLELPDEIQLLEGSSEKKLHSLGSQEEFLFTFRIAAASKLNTTLSAVLTYESV
jgi:hypothetical protein